MIQPTRIQRIQRVVAHALLSLPEPLLRLAIGAPISHDGQLMDTQIQLLVKLQRIVRRKPVKDLPLATIRTLADVQSSSLSPEMIDMASIESLTLDGPNGPIPARLFRPTADTESSPALVYFHGGGFVVGSVDSHEASCRYVAAKVPCVVISVDYRLAPEHPFPAGVEDAIAAFRTVAGAAEDYGIDPGRIAIGGDSSGANLAAVVAQQTSKDTIRPCAQILFYPTVDATMSFPSVQKFGSGFMLEKMMMDWFMGHYLPPGQNPRNPQVSPLYGELEGLPPAFVLTAGFDPLRDEGEAYARKLEAAGVEARLRRYEGLIHGFFSVFGSIRAAKVPVDEAIEVLRNRFLA